MQYTLEDGCTFANSYMSLSQRYLFVTTVQGQTHVFVSDLATEAGKAKIPLAIRFRASGIPTSGAQPIRKEQKEIEQVPGFKQVYSAKTN